MYKKKIGLEIHTQLNTNSKLFSSSPNSFSDQPNVHVSPFDMGCPGILPLLNKKVVNKAICAGKVLNCHVNNISKFDRKHYSYPDLPLGYQLTQFYEPICINGHINLSNNKTIRINRIHIEADAGKLIRKDNICMIDYNRCGAPLLEIVTEPDFSSSEEVVEFLRKLIRNLEYANVSDCAMEKGNLRCDINISIYDDKKCSERVEIKNVNSIQFIKDAIEYEYERQVELLSNNQKYDQHTRSYNDGITTFMRKKETFQEYRYMRCGNIPILKISDEYIRNVHVPENYDEKFTKYMHIINNSEVVARILNDKKTCDFFEKIISELTTNNKIIMAANLLACDLIGLCTNDIKPYNNRVTTAFLIELVNMYCDGLITMRTTKNVLCECFTTGFSPMTIIKQKDLFTIIDDTKLNEILNQIIDKNNNLFNQFINGNDKLQDALIGKAMNLTGGKIHVDKFKNLLQSKKNNKQDI